jgi:hypothetical protein
MEMDRFEEIVRAFATTPSRRVITRALVALTMGTFLAPPLRGSEIAEGKKTHHHNHRKKKRKKTDSGQCSPGFEYCSAGDYSDCCNTQTNSEGDPVAICTDCGCCEAGFSKCCASGGDGQCCPNDSKCCYSDDFKVSACCGPTDKCCGAGCCKQNDPCCKTTGENPFYYCCDGSEGLTCKPSGGPTCVQA